MPRLPGALSQGAGPARSVLREGLVYNARHVETPRDQSAAASGLAGWWRGLGRRGRLRAAALALLGLAAAAAAVAFVMRLTDRRIHLELRRRRRERG